MALQRGRAFSGESNVQWANSRVTPNIFDVFINHRGDVKENLARPLHKSLKEKGIQVFFDSEELETGDFFPAALEQAINSAVVQIAIFSKMYCGSRWCLDELVLMLQSKAKIIPVFYDVEPSELRYLEKETGGEKKREYDEAFAKHANRYPGEKVQQWKEALKHASEIHGEEFQKHNNDHKSLLEKIVSVVVEEVERTRLTKLDVADLHPVGVDDLVEDFERIRSQNREEKVEIVGIYGIGGSGKSTLARELYNRKQSEYDGFCFLSDVGDAGKKELPSFQSRLLKGLLRVDRPKFYCIDEGKTYLRNRLRRSSLLRFLLVLDDVSNRDQLDALLIRDALSHASLVIVTTRDEGVLIQAKIKNRYKVKEMKAPQKVELFCWSAFNTPYPPIKFQEWVDRFVKFCGALPLSLRVTGALVSGLDDENDWQLIWNKVQKSVPEDLKKILKINFDMLDREEQQIFMDIACFFSGKPRCMALKIWKGCKWGAELALKRLKDKCLVEEVCLDWYQYEFDDKLSLRMHDRIRDFGREMARELNLPHRLMLPEHHTSQAFEQILSTTSGQIFRSFHSIYDRSMGSQITYFLGNCDDTSKTVLLWLELDMDGFEQTSLPTWISLKKLQCLRISFSQLKRLWQNRAEAPSELTELVLHESSLAECTSILRDLNHLEKLVLSGRKEKRPIQGKFLSESLSKLTKLRSLVLRYFALNGELALDSKSTSSDSSMSSLETMEVRGIKLVSKVSISGEHCPKLNYLYLDSMENLIEVDLTLTTLNFLELRCCENLKRVLGDFNLAGLVILNVLECWELQELPSLAGLSCVESITIDGCSKLESVSGIEELPVLKYLHLSTLGGGVLRNCIQRLQVLPTEMISVIGKANHNAKLAVNADNFFEMIGVGENAEGGIRKNKNIMMLEDPGFSFSAIIVCAVVRAPYGEESNSISIPHACAVIKSSVGGGEWMVTAVVTGQKELRYGEFPIVTLGTIVKKRWIMTVKVGAEDGTLALLRRIIDHFY